jgi:lysozyme
MRVSHRGLCELAGHEGIVPYPYFDSVGVLTVGIGHTASAGPPDPKTLPRGEAIPLEDVLAIFRRDVARVEARVNDAVKVPLAQHEFDALVSFDFNTGGIYRAKLTKHLNRGDRKAATAAFMGWRRPAEIIPRRQKEQALFRDGTYGDGHTTVYQASASGNVLWSTGKRVSVLDILRGPGRPVDGQKSDPAPVPRQPDDPGSHHSAAPRIAIGKAIAALLAAAVAAFLAWTQFGG